MFHWYLFLGYVAVSLIAKELSSQARTPGQRQAGVFITLVSGIFLGFITPASDNIAWYVGAAFVFYYATDLLGEYAGMGVDKFRIKRTVRQLESENGYSKRIHKYDWQRFTKDAERGN